MTRFSTFGRRIGAGFAVVVLLTLTVGAVSVLTLRGVVTAKNQVIDENTTVLVGSAQLAALSERRARIVREYLLTGTDQPLAELAVIRLGFEQQIQQLRRSVRTEQQRQALDSIQRASDSVQAASDAIMTLRRTGATTSQLISDFYTELAPKRAELDSRIATFGTAERRLIDTATAASSQTVSTATWLIVIITFLAAAFAGAIAILLVRTLNRQITASVSQVRGSSAQLKDAATQQASGHRQQATAMNEISTTVTELLATTKQIAESAQHVATIAERTFDSARSGDLIVERAHDSISGVRTQVDLVVGHMLELGEKSQQVGGVLEIVAELAEQTNILAINASIEAAGAGEAGARFGVVADEIRKLADRVAGSTKEIRVMIDEVRSAVNTTIMATETGSKSVDASGRQFAEVSTAFRGIADLVQTTTQAAREIELSTKQQTGGVEQVKIATASVAQTAREAEANSSETEQTASRLAKVSGDLLRLVHANGHVSP
jgi:methyl-accepting chemotaxis protein